MSGYGHSGLEREEWEDRRVLRRAIVVVERRWPGKFDRVTSDLAWLCERIEQESGDGGDGCS